MLKRYAFFALVLLGITLGTAVNSRAQGIISTLAYDGTELVGYSETYGSPYDEWWECAGWDYDYYYEVEYCSINYYHEPWVLVNGYTIVANNATFYASAIDYYPTYDAFVPYDIPYPSNGTWYSAAEHWVGDDIYEQDCWGAVPSEDCTEAYYVTWEYDLGRYVTQSDPQYIQHLTYATFTPGPVVYVPGCMGLSADPGVDYVDFRYTWEDQPREEDGWANGRQSCIDLTQLQFLGTYHLLQAKSSHDGAWTWTTIVAGPGILTYIAFALQQPPILTLTATGTQEQGKDTHWISLINTGNVIITAAVNPPMQPITWAGGTDGGNSFQRIVSTAASGDTQVTASVGGATASVMIHVVDAASPPDSTPATLIPTPLDNVQMTSVFDFGKPGQSAVYGETWFGPHSDPRLAAPHPSYVANAFFSGNRWVFRLSSVIGFYREGVLQPPAMGPLGYPLVDLPDGSVVPFPIGENGTLNDASSKLWAKSDLDTMTGPVPPGPLVPFAPAFASGPPGTPGLSTNITAPPQMVYWVKDIIQAHEDFHRDDFYGNDFPAAMTDFQNNVVETLNPALAIFYDCNNLQTTTQNGSLSMKKGTWDDNVTAANNTAITNFALRDGLPNPADPLHPYPDGHEIRAYTFSNPKFVPIHDQIP
jgi:hypothetical protein